MTGLEDKNKMKPLRIGTRGSALALWQANYVRSSLAELHGVESELVRIRTSGDHLQTASVAHLSAQLNAQFNSKGIFIKELEDALLTDAVDLAVHSMKDVPTETPEGLAFPAITKREDVRDCLISQKNLTLKNLPPSARVGTSSLRRQALLRLARPDLVFVDLRGNVDTRMKKLAAGELDAIVLAKAGLDRLGFSDKITEVFSASTMLPAAGQGALGIESRAKDHETSKLVSALDDPETRNCVTAERALLRQLEGGCQVPLGAWARMENGELMLDACVLSPDGKEHLRRGLAGSASDAEALGKQLAQIMIRAGADRILQLAGRSASHG
ncbi:MAG TPA: hydroxymethylbilane synthase [Candidatus Limnocylindrales bacterium]|nr:hydroxymethylbilane synthase [Candidatus Limnocylindrales bacterium]